MRWIMGFYCFSMFLLLFISNDNRKTYKSCLIDKNMIKIDRNDVKKIVLDDLNKHSSVVLSGSYSSGKTTCLEKIGSELGLSINHVSEVNDPLCIGRGKLPYGDTILVDEASTYEPQEFASLRSSFDKAIIATHNSDIGRKYAKYLTGIEPIIYQID